MASALNWSDSLEYVALTDVGMRRASNQDAHTEMLAPDAQQWQRSGHVFAVCDGMGAHAAGELASQLAAEGIPHTYLKQHDQPPAEAIRRSIQDVNAQIYSKGQSSPDFQGMGTTASVLVLLPQGAIVAHVGDSRVYRLRGSRLEQLTFDHSLVWEMSAAGQVPKDAIPNFVPKNIITRSLGPHRDVQVDLEGPFPLEVGDTFLLCSDGLTGQVSDKEIGGILRCLPPGEAAAVLVDLANLRGGPDNVTVIIVRVKSPAISTAGGLKAQPLALGAGTEVYVPSASASRWLWITAAVCLAAAVLMGAVQWTIPALVALVAALAVGLISVLQRVAPTSREMRYLAPGTRLGAGPHASVECEPNQQLLAELISIVEQLRDAAAEEQWSIDWDRFNRQVAQGKEAAERRDFQRAVQEYASAMRFMMNQLRHQQARQATDARANLTGDRAGRQSRPPQ